MSTTTTDKKDEAEKRVFDIPKVQPIKGEIANRDTIRKQGTTGRTTYFIGVDKVVVRKGFNPRTISFGDIEALAKSILVNGQETPCKGDMTEDGKVYLVEGERRFKAFQYLRDNESKLRDEGFTQPIPTKIEFFINGKKTTEEERIITIFTSDDKQKLEPVEIALALKRLANMGYNDEQIAAKIGKSIWYVTDHLIIADSDPEIQQEITAGNISATSVVKASKGKVKLSQEEIKGTIKKAKAAGKTVKNADIKKAVAKKKARDIFANPVQFDEIEKVILQWSGWAYTGTKKDLAELTKEIKALYKARE